jgi:hypothetical protein
MFVGGIEMNEVASKKLCVYGIILIALMSSGYCGLLDEEIQISKGEMAAMQLNIYSQVVWKSIIDMYDAPLLATYDKVDAQVIVEIYGAQDKIGIAQSTIQQIAGRLKDEYIPYLKDTYNIDLAMYQIRIVYRNRNEEGSKVILRWENGEYKFPGE